MYDKINVKRCFKCWGFNHISNNCTNKICCPICSDEHSVHECKSVGKKCKNCVLSINKLNIDIDPCHDARDLSCPVYMKRLEKEKEKVAY